jgi:gamma-glutamyltranspeptidase/glutathione hydrolase
MAISVAGGDLQDQTALNLLLNAIDHGMRPAEAVTSPRFATDHHEDSFDPSSERPETIKKMRSLTLSDTTSAEVRKDLAHRGHDIAIKDGPIGTPVMLQIDDGGEAFAAGDPAANRHAAGVRD